MSQDGPQLDYAPQAPWHRRHSTKRAAMIVAGALIALSLWRFGPDAFRRAQMFYWQRQAMDFTTPDGTIAYTTDAAARAKCLALGSSYISRQKIGAALVVRPWEKFYGAYSPPGGNGAVAFCHGLISAGKQERLVVVTISNQADSELMPIVLIPQVFVPGSLLSRPSQVLLSGNVANAWGSSATVYMGKLDPSDASHFTIDVDFRGQRQTYDGYLKDDDTVTLELRIPPATLVP